MPLEAIAHRKAVAVDRIEATEMHLKAYNAQVIWFSVDDQASITRALYSLTDSNTCQKLVDANEPVIEMLKEDSVSQPSRNYWAKIIDFVMDKRSKPILAITSEYRVAYYG